MTFWIERHCPPGSNGKGHFHGFLSISCFFTLLITFHFIHAYYDSYRDLFTKVMGQKVLRPETIMPDFVSLHDPILPYIVLYALFALILVGTYYSTYRLGSKSIYLMKRLPDPWERWRLCLTLPTLALLFFMLILGVILLLTFAFYLLLTPEGALTPQQGQKFWVQSFQGLPDLVKQWLYHVLGGYSYA